MAWALVTDGQVELVMDNPPSTLVLEDGATVLGAAAMSTDDLRGHGWLPISDPGVTYDPGTQEWDGQPPSLRVGKTEVSAVYGVRDLAVSELRARAIEPIDAALSSDTPPNDDQAKTLAEEKARLKKAPRDDFAEGDRTLVPFLL